MENTLIGLVGTFFKSAGGRLTLDSLTTFTNEHSDYYKKHYVSRTGYDVDYSRRFGYLYHESSGGGDNTVEVSGIYFTSGKIDIKEKPAQFVDVHDKPPWRGKGTKAIRKRNRTRRLSVLPKAFDMEGCEDLLDWLGRNAIESGAVYCSTCKDYFPGYQECDMCGHIWWCEKTGWWSTPSERCNCNNREACENDGGE